MQLACQLRACDRPHTFELEKCDTHHVQSLQLCNSNTRSAEIAHLRRFLRGSDAVSAKIGSPVGFVDSAGEGLFDELNVFGSAVDVMLNALEELLGSGVVGFDCLVVGV